jgi:hypothetical protein
MSPPLPSPLSQPKHFGYTHTHTHPHHHHHHQVDDAGKIASLVTTESDGSKDDVTGGMELKLSTAIAIQVPCVGCEEREKEGGWVAERKGESVCVCVCMCAWSPWCVVVR